MNKTQYCKLTRVRMEIAGQFSPKKQCKYRKEHVLHNVAFYNLVLLPLLLYSQTISRRFEYARKCNSLKLSDG